MKWLRALLAVPLLLLPAAPAAALDTPPMPIPSWCLRDILIDPVAKAEGTVSQHETGFTWFAFTVRAGGCPMTGASAVYRTAHLDTEDNDLILESGTLTWNPFDMSSRTVYVKVLKDSTLELDEQFVLKVVCPDSQRISGGTHTTGTILNDDGPPLDSEPVPYNYHCRQ